jgi:hypothetical protein
MKTKVVLSALKMMTEFGEKFAEATEEGYTIQIKLSRGTKYGDNQEIARFEFGRDAGEID